MSHWNSTLRNKMIGSPQSRPHNMRPYAQETSLCICHNASYTLEAVIIIPFMAAFLVSILFFFRILQIQVAVEEALLYAGRKIAVESCVVPTEEVLLLSAKGYFVSALKDNELVEQYVEGGYLGVLLLGSECEGDKIILRASYDVRMPVSFGKIGRIPLYSQNSFQKWNGDKSIGQDEWVYVTSRGEVYHISSTCRILDLSVQEVSLAKIHDKRGKNGQKYYACNQCCIGTDNDGKVYCTDYGNLYHYKASCSYLKRTVSKIPKSEIGERRPCSFCCEGE